MAESISEKIINQRYYSLILNSIGEKIRINLISGDTIEGLLYTIDPINNEYLLLNNPRRFSRTGVPIFLKESMLKIYFKEILTINYQINNFIPKNKKNEFLTDSQISKKNNNSNSNEEKLVKFELNEEDKNEKYFNQKLDDNEDENWDQFDLNKKMYNVVSTYDENLYTTKLDKNKISEDDKKFADKIYNEIINSNNEENNIHVLEDRGIIKQNDDNYDEEDKYSSVIKNNKKWLYNDNKKNIIIEIVII